MLAKEVRARRRYSHVVRMRTDTIAYFDWGAVHQFHEIIPPLSQVVSGPGFNNDRNAWYMHDVFWIAARAAASRAFVGFAHSLETHVDRKELCLYLDCSWPPNVVSNRRGGEFSKYSGQTVFSWKYVSFDEVISDLKENTQV